ncbi:YlcI/YnfO family protein [Fischerella sp. JS2]|uniref:YlcI/YnfO family protein n=1 Tax=Fischerella sp. JS2 TaxID=2597771 RepID=UPI0028EB1645|nr:YlcI/YnfO family protein [Fischerella sp. JS2]
MERETLTIRFPAQLLQKIRALKRDDESLNDLVVQALEKEMKWRSAWAAHKQIQTIREQVKQRTGVHPDPVPLIRQLREGEGRRD